MVRLLLREPHLRALVEREVTNDILRNRGMLASLPWEMADILDAELRPRLFANPKWRRGPLRILEVARETFAVLSAARPWAGGTFCELGCGHHPYGLSAVFFLNGLSSGVATDITRVPAPRVALALYDLLVDCTVRPTRWNWGGLSEREWRDRLACFSLPELQDGRLADGVAGAPIRYVCGDINVAELPDESFDFMSSRAVLEHLLDFESAARRLFRLMRPGGVAYHVVDLIDHRHYVDPERFHPWSFLSEDERWTDHCVNRLRSCELTAALQRAGFEIIRSESVQDTPPRGFREALHPNYAAMSDDELATTQVNLLIRKPGSAPC